MAVELVYGESILWASGGDEGRVTLQIAPEKGPSTALTSRGRVGDFALEPPIIEDSLPVDTEYLISDALEGELGRIRGMDPHLRREIHRGIAQVSADYKDYEKWFPRRWPVFDSHQALLEALRSLRVEHDAIVGPELTTSGDRFSQRHQGQYFTPLHGRMHVDSALVHAIRCDRHEDPMKPGSEVYRVLADSHEDRPWSGSPERCKCIKVEQLIGRFAMIVYCLARCRYDAATTRISRRGTRMIEHFREGSSVWHYDESSPLFETISLLFLNGDAQSTCYTIRGKHEKHGWARVLGVSGASCTVFFTSLLQDDCFDGLGRAITITPGRASVRGVLRNVILENTRGEHREQTYSGVDRLGMTTSLAPGATIAPHYRPSPVRIIMSAGLSESYILMQTSANLDGRGYRPFCLAAAFDDMDMAAISVSCGHAQDQGFVACSKSDGGYYRISPFSPFHSENEGELDRWIYALQGHKLEQVLQLQALEGKALLQLFVCMRCAIRLAKEGEPKSIIMGG